MDNPKLRNVEVIPVRDDMFALRDPMRYTDKILMVPGAVLAVISYFDGRHSMLDVQYEFTRKFGDILFQEKLAQIIESLDANGFLESESFAERRKAIDDGFAAAKVRQPAHAGGGYEAEPEKLRDRLSLYFMQAAGGAADGGSRPEAAGSLRAIIAPHIDMQRGGTCYANAYGEVRRLSRANTIVLLGISHVETRNRYALTEKDFATPLGNLATDGEAVRRLVSACSFDPFQDESAHRFEHSLEFQTVFLRYIFPERDELRIVPILCGPLLPEFTTRGSPREDPQVASFIDALTGLLAERRDDVLLIAGADLCHIGRRFGDTQPFTEEFVSTAQKADGRMLERVTGVDAEGFMKFIQKEQDGRKVCGVPAIYTLLSALKPDGKTAEQDVHGSLLSYDMAVDQEGQSAVGFAAVAFAGI